VKNFCPKVLKKLKDGGGDEFGKGRQFRGLLAGEKECLTYATAKLPREEKPKKGAALLLAPPQRSDGTPVGPQGGAHEEELGAGKEGGKERRQKMMRA